VRIGDIDIVPVVDGSILARLPATKPFPDPASEAWREQHGIFRPDGLIESTLGGFVVHAGERVLLVDAGGGPEPDGGYAPPAIDVDDPDDPFVALFRDRGVTDELLVRVADHFSATQMERGRLPGALAANGVRPEDVTDLVFTHLHFDHIGWASAGGAACFPNATVRCAAPDLDHFLAGEAEEDVTSLVYRTPAAPERLAPVLDRIETWESDGTIAPGVDVRLAPGHTPGSSVVVLSDGDARAMLLGDMIHCPLELTDDDFDLLVDHDQELANRVRESYARELEGSDVAVAAAHFPGLQFGRLLPGEGARRWVFDGG
jgi:glyoxylase-like metal-dependent hydrolase (beta-lactamase superfamily II)